MLRTLNTSGSALFISDGKGGSVARISLGPQRFGESWDVKSASISCSSIINQSACRLYRTMETPSTFIDGTSTANLNVTNIETILGTLESLLFVFTGGDIGTYATVVLNGTTANSRETT